jgi:small GTP-binding protein
LDRGDFESDDFEGDDFESSDRLDEWDAVDRELDAAIESLADLDAELAYRQARSALRSLMERLDLTPRERSGLEPDLEGLAQMLDKLEDQRVQIAVFGAVSRGKSSLLNALLGRSVFETGPTHGVTQSSRSIHWTVPSSLGQVELVDTPGIDEVNGAARAALAREVGQASDLILFVVAGDMTQVECEALSQLREAGKPILLVLNKIDQFPEADRQAIYEKIRDDRVRELLSPDEIVMVAAAPLVAQVVQRPDGTIAADLQRGAPQVESLKLKILEVLAREGKALVALDRSADRLIWNGTIAKAIAVAVNPVVVLDLVGGAAIDLATILALSRLYGIPMGQRGAIALMKTIAIGLGGLSAGEWIARLGLSALKGFLGLSTVATGGITTVPYLSIAATQAAIAGVSSYAIGQATKTYLANDASWGPDGPRAAIGRVLATLDEQSIVKRIEAELWAKLGRPAVPDPFGSR